MFNFRFGLLLVLLVQQPWLKFVVHGQEEPIYLNATSGGPQHCFKKILFMYKFTTQEEFLKKEFVGGRGRLEETQAKVKSIAKDLNVYSQLAKKYEEAQAYIVNPGTREVGRTVFEALYYNPKLREAENQFKDLLAVRLDYYESGHTSVGTLIHETLWKAGQSGVSQYLKEAIKYVNDCVTSLRARKWFPDSSATNSKVEDEDDDDEELDHLAMDELDQLLAKLSYGQTLLDKAERGEDIGFGPDIDPAIATEVLRRETFKVTTEEIPSFVAQHEASLSRLLTRTIKGLKKLEPLMMKMTAEYELVGDEIEKWDSMLESQSHTLKTEYEEYDRAREETKLVYSKYYKITEQTGTTAADVTTTESKNQRDEF